MSLALQQVILHPTLTASLKLTSTTVGRDKLYREPQRSEGQDVCCDLELTTWAPMLRRYCSILCQVSERGSEEGGTARLTPRLARPGSL